MTVRYKYSAYHTFLFNTYFSNNVCVKIVLDVCLFEGNLVNKNLSATHEAVLKGPITSLNF